MHIESRQWVATWWQCGHCKQNKGTTKPAPSGQREDRPRCRYCHCKMGVRERRTYTVFATDGKILAGTLEHIGPFALCTLVFPTIRTFRNFVASVPDADLPELAYAYQQKQHRLREEAEALEQRRQAYADLHRGKQPPEPAQQSADSFLSLLRAMRISTV